MNSHSSHFGAIVCNAKVIPTFAPVSELSWSTFIDAATAALAAAFHVAARCFCAAFEPPGICVSTSIHWTAFDACSGAGGSEIKTASRR